MTGRPETPLPDSGPVVPLARRLRELREQSGLSYRQMADTAKYTPPALSMAANGKKLPPLDRVEAYLRAVGADAHAHAGVIAMWTEARDEISRAKTAHRRGLKRSAAANVVIGGNLAVPVEPPRYFSADPEKVENFEQFSTALNQILAESGYSVPQVIAQSSAPTGQSDDTVVRLKKTTTYDVLAGKAKPSPTFTQVFLRSCGMAPALTEAWVQRLRNIQAATSALKELTKQSDDDQVDPDHVDLSQVRVALQRRWANEDSPPGGPRAVWLSEQPAAWGVGEFENDFVLLSSREALRQDDAQRVVAVLPGDPLHMSPLQEEHAAEPIMTAPETLTVRNLRLALAASIAVISGLLILVVLLLIYGNFTF